MKNELKNICCRLEGYGQIPDFEVTRAEKLPNGGWQFWISKIAEQPYTLKEVCYRFEGYGNTPEFEVVKAEKEGDGWFCEITPCSNEQESANESNE